MGVGRGGLDEILRRVSELEARIDRLEGEVGLLLHSWEEEA